LETFEQVWQVVNDYYLYPDFNGVDWAAAYEEYRERVQAGLTDEEFYQAMDEMIFSLGDEHSTFFSPQEAAEIDEEYAGRYDFVGIGVMTSLVPERERLTVLLVFPGSPADRLGLKAHDSLISINGEALVVAGEANYHLLRGPEGSQVELVVQSPGEAPRSVTLDRQRINSPLPVPYQVLLTPGGKRIGYLMLTTFHDSNVDEGTGAALAAMTSEGALDGLIIDNRFNGGGASDVLSNTLAYFSDGVMGYFVGNNDHTPLEIEGQDVGGSQQTPIAVLVGPETASFGEIFAGILRDAGRAVIIGQPTEGNVEILTAFNFNDGSRAWIAYQTFRPMNNPDQDWEQTGIIPDIIAANGWDLFSLEQDPPVVAALDYFDGR
jgi:carboxyl-terminal processing protease